MLLKCFAGCSTESIMDALGMPMSLLFPDNGRERQHRPRPQTTPRNAKLTPPRRIVAVYPYVNEGGELLFEVVRFDPKDFRQRRPDGNGGYIWNLDGVRRVLYRLLQIIEAGSESFIFIVEGEKDADRLVSVGLVATTCPMGAGKWALVDDTVLHRRHVVIIPDHDEAGRKHAQQVANSLHGKAATVRVLQLPDLPEKGDVSDWLDAGGDPEDLVRLAEATSLWTPSPVEADRGIHDMSKSKTGRPILLLMAEVKSQPVRWLWLQRIALGKLTLIAGDPGLGKSFVTLDIAARVSTGSGWPDAPGQQFDPGGVVLLSAEDDPADTIRPRLDAAGADVSRITVVKGVTKIDPKTGEEIDASFCLATDLKALEEAIKQTPNCRLVIVDPITAYCGGVDSHKNAEVRGLFAPLSDLAERHGVAILAVTHLNKSTGGSAIYRTMGSVAYTAAARTVWCVIKDKDDPQRRLMLPLKNNLAPDVTGLAYSIRDEGMAAVVEWQKDVVSLSADEAMNPERRDDERSDRDQAADWLRDALTDGPMSSEDVFKQAKENGFSEKTIRRAFKDMGSQAQQDVVQRRVGVEIDRRRWPRSTRSFPRCPRLKVGHLRPIWPSSDGKHWQKELMSDWP